MNTNEDVMHRSERNGFSPPDEVPAIPHVDESMSTLEAAHRYAEAGLYLLPLRAGTKNPGNIVGGNWPDKSTRDIDAFLDWFTLSDLGLALHTGRSGIVVFDVDRPDRVPPVLKRELLRPDVPYQASDGTPGRGHYFFRVPPGKSFGTSAGRLGTEWGDVRGGNSVVVLCPSRHARAEEGAAYRWIMSGVPPLLPTTLCDILPQRLGTVTASSVAEHREFLESAGEGLYTELLESRIHDLETAMQRGTRHTTCLKALVRMFIDAAAGLYPAREAQVRIERVFRRHKPEAEWSSPSEFISMAHFASSVAHAIPEDERSRHRGAVLLARDYSRFIQGKGGAL